MKKNHVVLVAGMSAFLILAGLVMGAEPKTLETNWTWQQYAAKTSAATSTHSVVGVGFAYAIVPVGSGLTYHVKQTTRTYSGGTSVVSVSSYAYLPSGQPIASDFEAMTINPSIVITDLDTSATAYIYINYGVRKEW